MEEKKAKFSSKWGFILAAMGSAVGLGNIWRYPTVAYENGGGAFLIPYLIALVTAGIPILILEFSLGNKTGKDAPRAFKSISKKFEFLGWWQTMICFFVPIFYSGVLGWVAYYLFKSFNLGWGSDPSAFFQEKVLNLTGTVPTNPFNVGSLNIIIALIVFAVWCLIMYVMKKGIADGIEKVNKIMIPLLLFMFLIVVVYSVTLPGALNGLNEFFKPQWDQIGNPQIWLAAYGQIFFSLSIAAGIMLTYASYTEKDSDLNTNALITGFGNSTVEIMAGIGIFSALGFLSKVNNVPISEAAAGGPGLVFEIYPQILNQLPPGIGNVVAVLFYLSLLFAAFSSLISLTEVVISAIKGKFNVTRNRAVNIVIIPLMIISLIMTTRSGFYVLDIMDYFVNNIAWVGSGLVEITIIVIIAKKLKEINAHGNKSSSIKINYKIHAAFLVFTAILLAYFFITGVITSLTQGYGGYSMEMLMTYGWGVIILFIIVSIVFPLINKGKED